MTTPMIENPTISLVMVLKFLNLSKSIGMAMRRLLTCSSRPLPSCPCGRGDSGPAAARPTDLRFGEWAKQTGALSPGRSVAPAGIGRTAQAGAPGSDRPATLPGCRPVGEHVPPEGAARDAPGRAAGGRAPA